MSSDTVIVTGGARGLGRAIAEALRGRHARILLADREVALGEATARELGEGVAFHPLDIADPLAISAFFAACSCLNLNCIVLTFSCPVSACLAACCSALPA